MKILVQSTLCVDLRNFFSNAPAMDFAERLPLMTEDDPDPCVCVNADSEAAVVLLCEHAGRLVPRRLGDLGVSEQILRSHRGWDIGAEAVARGVAERLDAPLVLQRYSRLVIDCNRPPDCNTAIPHVSDGADVPGNLGLSAAEREQRITEIFAPMNLALTELFGASPRRFGFSIHSFTPRMHGQARPWQAGFLARSDTDTPAALLEAVQALAPDLSLAINEPYRIEDETDWFIPAHCETRGVGHALIEIRNDEIDTAEGAARWAHLLASAIRSITEGTS